MKRKAVSGIMLTLLLISMLTLAFNIQPAKAWTGTVYIRADGSIDPPTAPIQRVGDVYTFTDNINDSIVVEKDNIILDGASHTLQGTRAWGVIGIDLSGRQNVTVRNTQIKDFFYPIYLDSSTSYNRIGRNNISGNNITWGLGIYLSNSHNNTINGNNMTNSAIWLLYSSYNSINRNNMTNSYISLDSSNNHIYENVFVGSGLLVRASGNVVEDNLVNGKPLVYLEDASDVIVEDAGQVILVHSNNITVRNLNVSNTYVAV